MLCMAKYDKKVDLKSLLLASMIVFFCFLLNDNIVEIGDVPVDLAYIAIEL